MAGGACLTFGGYPDAHDLLQIQSVDDGHESDEFAMAMSMSSQVPGPSLP